MADLDLDISTFIDVTQTGHGFVAGDVVYRTSGGAYALADATAEVSSQVVGMVAEGSGNDFKLALSGHKINGLSGFTDGSTYYLSETTTGGLTDTPPSAPNYVVPVCIAVSTTSVVVGNLGANIRVRGLNAEFFDTDLVEPVFAKIYRSGASNGRFTLINGNGVELIMEAGDGYIMFANTDVVISSDGDNGNPNLNIGPGPASNAYAFTVNGYEGLVFSIDKHGVITAANLSGTNTGDQDLSGLQPLDADLTAYANAADAAARRALIGAGTGNGNGDVVGPASATDNSIARFDLTTGKLIQNSGITIPDGATGTLSGTNTGDQTSVSGNAGTATQLATSRNIDGQAFNGTADITVIAPGTHAATSKTTPVDADELPLVDSAASNVLKKLTWANLKATVKTYFDTLYQSLNANLTAIAGLTTSANKVTHWTGSGTAALVDLNNPGSQTLAATVTFTAGANPATPTNTYNWVRIGNLVTCQFTLVYASAGTTVTNLVIALPSDMPAPFEQSGLTAASAQLYPAFARAANGAAATMVTNATSALRRNSADTAYEFFSALASGTYSHFYLTCSYFTA